MARPYARPRMRRPAGWKSPEAGAFIAQLDDLLRETLADLDGITADEIAWQPAPGVNTIGMLLVHIAIVEVYWALIALERYTPERFTAVLGIDEWVDGIPIPPDGGPPAALAGKSLGEFAAILRRARAFVRRSARGWSARDLDRVIVRRRGDGSLQRANRRWILYHLVEHFAGHYGQILLVRHLHRGHTAPVPGPSVSRRRAAPRARRARRGSRPGR